MSEKNNIDKKLSTIKNLLAKQNLVENLIHRQEMSRQDIVESLVQKQNSNELEKLIRELRTIITLIYNSIINTMTLLQSLNYISEQD